MLFFVIYGNVFMFYSFSNISYALSLKNKFGVIAILKMGVTWI